MPASFPKNPLRRPFPDRGFDRGLIMGHARTGIFIFAALYILKPFGLNFGRNALAICLGYGLVTFIIAVAYSYVTDRVLGWQRNGPDWTLGRWVLDCAGVLLLISLANFIYHNAIVGWGAFSFVVLVAIAVPTVLIGLFPIAISGVFIQMQAERDNQRTAGSLGRFASFSSGTAKRATAHQTTGLADGRPALAPLSDNFAVDPANILFCESRQNYVRVVFLREGLAAEETIRATLSDVEETLAGSPINRCHRSYLVNVGHVNSARGNAQGLRLNLVGTEEEVPVSRSFVPSLKEAVMR